MGVIQRPDLPERVRRGFGVREQGFASTVSPEIVPVAVVEDLTGPSIDTGYPRYCAGARNTPAVVAVHSWSMLINPATSNVDVITQEILIRMDVAVLLYVYVGVAADLANLLGGANRATNLDLRVQQFPSAYLDSRQHGAFIGGMRMEFTHCPLNAWVPYPLAFTLGPGDWLGIVPSTVNTSIQGFFPWVERLRTTT